MTTNDTAPFDYAGLPGKSKGARKTALKNAGLIVPVIFVSIASFWLGTSNLHEVEAGEFYRSGELTGTALETAIVEDSLKSVINLEGARPGREWYKVERAITQRHGIAHYDFPLHATTVPSPAEVDALIDLMRKAPKPMLIHCRSGADRAGLAAALYLSKLRHRDAETAEAQLSWRYGHFPYLGSATRAMDDAFAATQSR